MAGKSLKLQGCAHRNWHLWILQTPGAQGKVPICPLPCPPMFVGSSICLKCHVNRFPIDFQPPPKGREDLDVLDLGCPAWLGNTGKAMETLRLWSTFTTFTSHLGVDLPEMLPQCSSSSLPSFKSALPWFGCLAMLSLKQQLDQCPED